MPIWSARAIWTGSWRATCGPFRPRSGSSCASACPLGVAPPFCRTSSPPFVRRDPDVQVVLHEAPVPQLGDLAASSVTDFCLMHIPSDLTNLSYELVMHERILLISHRDHPWPRDWTAPAPPPPLRDLRRLEHERIIMLPEDWRLSKLLYNTFSVRMWSR